VVKVCGMRRVTCSRCVAQPAYHHSQCTTHVDVFVACVVPWVVQVFVANPEKPADILEILALNKARLITFLRNFQNEKGACRRPVLLHMHVLSLPIHRYTVVMWRR